MDKTRYDITKFNAGCALATADRDRSRAPVDPGGGTSIDLKMTSPEYSVVKAHIADINRRIPATDVSSYAYDLFQADLICEAGHDSAIAVTGIAPQGKVASLTSELRSHGEDQNVASPV